MNKQIVHHAQLWLGSHESLTTHVIAFLQTHFCTDHGCGTCITCMQIQNKQFYAIVWICPEKNYTLEQIEVIQERLAFDLAPDQRFFFIIQKADTLSPQCANSLLKSIEEPPQGYHFILCAERKEYILPTVISRCVLQTYATEASTQLHKTLISYFTAIKPQNPIAFFKEIQNNTITEQESLDLADRLLLYWIDQYKQAAHSQERNICKKRIKIFEQAIGKPPMPGSSKLFWKTIFLHYHA